jgi:hypothetical protein
MDFTDAAACHAAMRAGGAHLMWSSKQFTDQDAEWIASALADLEVRFNNRLPCYPDSIALSAYASRISLFSTYVAVLGDVRGGAACGVVSVSFEAGFWPRRHVDVAKQRNGRCWRRRPRGGFAVRAQARTDMLVCVFRQPPNLFWSAAWLGFFLIFVDDTKAIDCHCLFFAGDMGVSAGTTHPFSNWIYDTTK